MYSVARGTSLDKERLTETDSGVALVKATSFRRAKVSVTSSVRSIVVPSLSYAKIRGGEEKERREREEGKHCRRLRWA